MTKLLDQINELWAPHYVKDSSDGGSCLVFVIDPRCVEEHDTEYRLAVSFGDNPFPLHKPKGFLCPHPMPGRYCFGIHCVGTCGSRLAVFDQWYNAKAAEGCDDAVLAEKLARELLASISDEKYAMDVSCGERDRRPRMTKIELQPLDHYEFVSNETKL